MKLIIYTDGGARGNPGPAGSGAVIYDSQMNVIKECSKFFEKATNNQAEYEALILGLGKAKELKATEIDFYSDSQLIVEQLNQRYKIKNPNLGVLFIKIWNLSQSFKKVNFYHIPREKNKRADKLVNEVINKNINLSR
ncbi:MAG: ribonuclease HI family protein [Patescibacteria group bacterium]|nr:ribonuclease HI family protein [Patescibacteria group bacterium]MDD5172887.1 ribonuclease HI family protein [Patescibacteria group bacterium]